MKGTFLVFLTLVLMAAASSVSAGEGRGNSKKTIRHCGCVYDSLTGTDMIYHDIRISGRSGGHANHEVGTQDTCFAGLDDNGYATYEDWERTGADCDFGNDPSIEDCDEFEGPEEFDSCGFQVIEE